MYAYADVVELFQNKHVCSIMDKLSKHFHLYCRSESHALHLHLSAVLLAPDIDLLALLNMFYVCCKLSRQPRRYTILKALESHSYSYYIGTSGKTRKALFGLQVVRNLTNESSVLSRSPLRELLLYARKGT